MEAKIFGDGSLRELLTHRGYWRWSLATQLIRLPTFMAAIAYVLVSIEILGDPGTGGLLLAVMFIVIEISAPFTGRLVDRLGIAKWAPRLLLMAAAGRLLLAGAFVISAPTWALVLLVAVFAVLGSGAGGIVRVMLAHTVPDRMLGRALAIDATVVEFVLIGAPFVVAAAALAGGLSPLIVMAVSTGVGAMLLWRRTVSGGAAAATSAKEPTQAGADSAAGVPDGDAATGAVRVAAVGAEVGDASAQSGGSRGETGAVVTEVDPEAGRARRPRSRSLWRNRQFVFWVLVAIAFGHVLGTAEIGALPAALELGGNNAAGAALVAALGGASAAAGLLYAWRGAKIALGYRTQACLLLALMAAGALVIALPAGWLVIFVGFAAVGLWTAPINTVRSYAAGLVLPANRQVEGFAIIDTANGIGFALAAVLLSVLPLSAMLGAGVITPLIVLALAPVLLLGGGPGVQPEVTEKVATSSV